MAQNVGMDGGAPEARLKIINEQKKNAMQVLIPHIYAGFVIMLLCCPIFIFKWSCD